MDINIRYYVKQKKCQLAILCFFCVKSVKKQPDIMQEIRFILQNKCVFLVL